MLAILCALDNVIFVTNHWSNYSSQHIIDEETGTENKEKNLACGYLGPIL